MERQGWNWELGLCMNCGSSEVTSRSPLYCSIQCRQAAKLVRYVRARRRDGTATRPDIAEAIEMRVATVLGGGYPENERRVPPALSEQVFREANGRCEKCGRVLDFDRSTGDPDAIPTIQHVYGNSNELSNLKAFCQRCNMADAQSRFVPVQPGSPQSELLRELTIRWSAPIPLRLCDDEEQWSSIWRDIMKKARTVIEEREESDGGCYDEDLPGFLGWTDGGTPIQDC